MKASSSNSYFLALAFTLSCVRVTLSNEGLDPTTHTKMTDKNSEKDNELIQKLEKHLLSIFGFKTKPKPAAGSIKVHPYMLELYKYAARENGQDISHDFDQSGSRIADIPLVDSPPGEGESHSVFNNDILANTIRVFTHNELPGGTSYPSHTMVLKFNISTIAPSEKYRAAELRLKHLVHPSLPSLEEKFRNVIETAEEVPEENSEDSSKKNPSSQRWRKEDVQHLQRIRIYDIMRPAKGTSNAILKFLGAVVIDARKEGTVSLDVSSALVRWAEKPRTNYGLFIEVTPFKKNSDAGVYKSMSHVRLRRETVNREVDSNEVVGDEPLLVVHTDDGNAKPRPKRSYGNRKRYCQRYHLFVDFKKVEWNNWIVAPSGYQAFFCQGDCPFPLASHLNATNHAVIQNIVHSRTPARVPSACCVPVEHSAISMLYVDEYNRVILKNYQDMVVESCGCR